MPMAWVTCTAGRALLMLDNVYSKSCHPDNVFFGKGLVYFGETMPNRNLRALQQHGSVAEVSGC